MVHHGNILIMEQTKELPGEEQVLAMQAGHRVMHSLVMAMEMKQQW